jgi:hypothetical protein
MMSSRGSFTTGCRYYYLVAYYGRLPRRCTWLRGPYVIPRLTSFRDTYRLRTGFFLEAYQSGRQVSQGMRITASGMNFTR